MVVMIYCVGVPGGSFELLSFVSSHPSSSSAFLLTNTSVAVTRCGITDGEPPAQISFRNLAFIVLHL